MDQQQIPTQIGDLPVIRWSPIDARHRVTGACLHFNLSTGVEDPVPAIVAIVGGGTGGLYWMRFDMNWQFITDTWHETLEEASDQAEFEYEGISKTWVSPGDKPAKL